MWNGGLLSFDALQLNSGFIVTGPWASFNRKIRKTVEVRPRI